MTDTVSRAELAQIFRDMADRIDGTGKPRRTRKAKGSVPDAPIAETAIPPDEMAFRRQRGWLNHFCKLEGKEWIGDGPNPLDPGCSIDPRILAEFAPQLAAVREEIAEEQKFPGKERFEYQ